MRVIIAGTRSIKELVHVEEAIMGSPWRYEITKVISGGDIGPGQNGIEWARENGIEVEDYACGRAEGEKYGKDAWIPRNIAMAKRGQGLIAVWDGKSRRTAHMIAHAVRYGVEVYIWPATV